VKTERGRSGKVIYRLFMIKYYGKLNYVEKGVSRIMKDICPECGNFIDENDELILCPYCKEFMDENIKKEIIFKFAFLKSSTEEVFIKAYKKLVEKEFSRDEAITFLEKIFCAVKEEYGD